MSMRKIRFAIVGIVTASGLGLAGFALASNPSSDSPASTTATVETVNFVIADGAPVECDGEILDISDGQLQAIGDQMDQLTAEEENDFVPTGPGEVVCPDGSPAPGVDQGVQAVGEAGDVGGDG